MQIMCRIHYSFNCLPERCTVTGYIRFDTKILSCKKNRASMSSHIAGYDNRISRLRKSSAYFYTIFNLPHSGRCNKYAIHLSFTCNLCVTGYDMYTSLCGCFFHCGGDFFQFFHWKALFNNKCAGQIQWFCPHTCEVIHRSADRKFADVSTRKKCR